ncbi:MAG: deoxyhypusine synthase [Candidatus Bathyarchaeota archaeon]|jgi:deoxyhypusine synthase|nr:deoxyhypusine synthase [Candidatus Bathyarchaeota archaeon]MDD4325449.1 deoxyhypusine synthase [Candidatus Bathyarchaeota archaeon]MDI9577399.1 deoxyhypusine synthase [Thermoproteota archaeon]MDT8782829.1 deoxyhypusine synthase [Candidatus Bathyarchaeota archaeon]NLD66788.1 deoxyhypusine synthase [Thermoproteota archaeon]
MPKKLHKVAVKDYQFTEKMTVDELVSQMDKAWGFTSGKLATGVNILEDMINSKGCTKFLSFTADIVATGTRGVLKEIVKRKLVDVIITTCGTLDHDVARCWKDYYKGSFVMSDSKLHQEGVNRLGNVLVPNDSYGIIIEEKIQKMLNDLYQEGKHELSSAELSKEIGLRCCNETSILYWAAKNDIPVFVPGITDGAVGYQLWFFSQDHKDFRINLLKDEGELSNMIFDSKESGALIIGGGISKHHTIWWNQFRDGLDYVVYISTANEWDGSLSGARPREAVSWGKISEKAKRVMVEADATMVMPIITTALIDRLNKNKS